MRPPPRRGRHLAAAATATAISLFAGAAPPPRVAAFVIPPLAPPLGAAPPSSSSSSWSLSRRLPPVDRAPGGGGRLRLPPSEATGTRRSRRASAPALAGWFGGGKGGEASTAEAAAGATKVKVGEHVGSGSYGTVHLVTLDDGDGDGDGVFVGKRAWTYEELLEKAREAEAEKKEKEAEGEGEGSESNSESSPGSGGAAAASSSGEAGWMESEDSIRERADRCEYYIDVERHCLTKLNGLSWDGAAEGKECVAELVGTRPDGGGNEWLVFRLVARGGSEEYGDAESSLSAATGRPALSLAQAMEMDWADQHSQDPSAGEDQHHHLYIVQREMGLPSDSTFADTLDAVLRSLLRAVSACHVGNVVHRDVKPQNLLCDPSHGGLVLIDFGSAADMDPKEGVGGWGSALGGNEGRVGLEDSSRVAVSPIYAAPETFVRWDRAPLNFDTFSCALIFCQLLFNLLDERTDAAFHQQLEFAKYDLDTWLEREFESTLTPAGVDDAFGYLAERPGLWKLLKDMLNSDPELRASSASALSRLDSILSAAKEGKKLPSEEADGEFFASFLSSLELYEMKGPEGEAAAAVEAEGEVVATTTTTAAAAAETAESAFIVPRPLHYVATFERDWPLGLVLSEVDPTEEYDGEDDPDARAAWERATRGSKPGEVYVKGIAEDGQADRMGIFEVGDRLRAVGEVPVFDGGFEFAVDLLGKQPRSARTVKLHFDRRSVGRSHKYNEAAAHRAKVVGQGAWSSVGRRKAQEDAFVLHEIHDEMENAVLMAAIFDGHGGAAASSTASKLLPSLFAAELATIAAGSPSNRATSSNFRKILETSWDITCNSYRSGCTDNEECVADYDPREGIVFASMTSKDLVAGTTAAAAVLSVAEDGADTLTVLNCGDSRSLLVGRLRDAPAEDRLHHESVVHFSTRDHCPSDEMEMERLRQGIPKGYSQPKRSMSRWRVPVGDYSYALSRSLEGPFATSKGIVSDPDVTEIDLVEMLSERDGGVLVIASDGMFEVMDNEQVGREVLGMREMGMTANDAAKYICRMANEKGTSDNVSAVVVYLD